MKLGNLASDRLTNSIFWYSSTESFKKI